jgi:hypothetical protein
MPQTALIARIPWPAVAFYTVIWIYIWTDVRRHGFRIKLRGSQWSGSQVAMWTQTSIALQQ